MATNRRIYQGKALFVGPTGAGTIDQIHRVQSVNHSFNVTRQDVNQYGQLAAVSREIIEQATVSFDFNYLSVDVGNEYSLGFTVDGSSSAITNILAGTADQKSYYLEYVPEGNDAVGYTTSGNFRVFAIGNAFISNYTAQGAVGGFPSAAVTVEALNIKSDTGGTGIVPTINPVDGIPVASPTYSLPPSKSGEAGQFAAVRPGDITVTITPSDAGKVGIGVDISDAKIQSYNISYALTRENLNKLGSRFAFAKPIQFPATATATIAANVGDLVAGEALSNVLCNDKNYDISVTLREPRCTGVGPTVVLYQLLGAKLDSQNISTSIGSNDSVNLTFSTQIGGPQDTTKGIFISGVLN